MNNTIKDSELYKGVKAITDELLKGLSDKIAYLVCTYKTAVIEQAQQSRGASSNLNFSDKTAVIEQAQQATSEMVVDYQENKTAVIEQAQPEKSAEKRFLAKIEFNQNELLKDFCKENKIGCVWFAKKKSWNIYSNYEHLLTKVRDFVLTELKGKIF